MANGYSSSPQGDSSINIITDEGFTGILQNHPWSKQFMVLSHNDTSISLIPFGFFRNWMDEEPNFGSFVIGRCSGIGVGSIVKYDGNDQKLVVGRFVAGGARLRFVLNGQHTTNTMTMAMLGVFCAGLNHANVPHYGDTVLKNDIWIGDEAMILGGATIENGCIIGARSLVPPNFKSEPYGVYVGSPAKLVKFRFSEKVREALVQLAWWEKPLHWIASHNNAFLQQLDGDEVKALDIIAELTADS